MKKILILTSGNVSKLDGFPEAVDKGSFADINFDSDSSDLRFKNKDLKIYGAIYFRMVGNSLEIATLVADYAIKNNIILVDKLYSNTLLMPITLAKSIEMRKLYESGIKIPKTVFGDFSKLDFPFIVKSTSGQKAREVWLVKNQEDFEKLKREKFVKDKHYLSQELIPNAERVRVMVVGDRAVGAIKRHTKWNKSEVKETLSPVPVNIANLAISATKAVNLDVCGVDILINSQTNEMYVIEANAAPAWKLINKYCGVKVEDEIVKYIQTKV